MTSIRSSATSDLSGALPCRSGFLAGMTTKRGGLFLPPHYLTWRSSALFLSAGFLAALLPAFARRFLALLFPSTGTAFLSALFRLVHGGPGAFRRFLLADAALFVTARDLLGFAFLFSRIFLFASFCHGYLPVRFWFKQENEFAPGDGFIAEPPRFDTRESDWRGEIFS